MAELHDSVLADLGCSDILGFPVIHMFITIIEANVIDLDVNIYTIAKYYISYL